MKAKDLEKGLHVAYSDRQDWMRHTIRRVEVLRAVRKPLRWSVRDERTEVPFNEQGAQIEVREVRDDGRPYDGTHTHILVVPLGQLKGLWSEVEPVHTKARLDREERDRAARAASADSERRAESLAEALRQVLGLPADRYSSDARVHSGLGSPKIQLSLKTAQLLLDLATGVETIEVDAATGEVLTRSWQ
jgi:hypothetical protein